MSRTVLALAAATFLLAGAACSQDEGSTTSIEGSNYLRYDEGDEVDSRQADSRFPDNMLPRHFFEDRLRLDVYHGALRVGGRLLYFRPSAEDKYRDGLADESRVDKRYVEASYAPLRVRVGDFSDIWANGLTLSAFENRDLYFDSELDGARAEFDLGPITATGLRGTSKDGRLVKKADVTAGRLHTNFRGSGVGFSYVFIDSSAYPRTHAAGLDWRLARGPFTLYGERTWNETYLSARSVEGHATYVGTVISRWKTSLLLEYKDYDYVAATPFQNPATVYREIGPHLLFAREPHVINIPDEVGYQIEVTSQILPTTFLTGHYNLSSRHRRNLGGLPRPTLQQENAPYWEGFLSVDQELPRNRSLFVELGANEEAAVQWQLRKWGWVRLTTPVRDKQELEFETEALLITDRTRDDEEFTDLHFGVAWSSGRGLAVSLQHETTNDDRIEAREGNNWTSGEAALSLGEGKHRLSLFYGRERGGLRCSNGVCRQVQAFSGLRLTLETTF